MILSSDSSVARKKKEEEEQKRNQARDKRGTIHAPFCQDICIWNELLIKKAIVNKKEVNLFWIKLFFQ